MGVRAASVLLPADADPALAAALTDGTLTLPTAALPLAGVEQTWPGPAALPRPRRTRPTKPTGRKATARKTTQARPVSGAVPDGIAGRAGDGLSA